MNRIDNRWMGVSEDHRSKGQAEVRQFLALGRGDDAALGFRGKYRIASDTAKGADRGVDPTGDHGGSAVDKMAHEMISPVNPRSWMVFRVDVPTASQLRVAAFSSGKRSK